MVNQINGQFILPEPIVCWVKTSGTIYNGQNNSFITDQCSNNRQ